MSEFAFLNGKVMPLKSAFIPVEDRGLQFGDSVYEVIRCEHGRLLRFDGHWERLNRNLNRLNIPYKITKEKLKEILVDLSGKTGEKKAVIYLQITRGVAPREHRFPKNATPNVIITARKYEEPDPELRERGVECILAPDERWKGVSIKTTNLLPNCLAKEKAHSHRAFEAILYRENGLITEATSSNIFVRFDDTFSTPHRGNILEGVTRKEVLRIIKELNFKSIESRVYINDLFSADEIFLSGTTIDVMPVTSIQKIPVGGGKSHRIIYQKLKGEKDDCKD